MFCLEDETDTFGGFEIKIAVIDADFMSRGCATISIDLWVCSVFFAINIY